MSVFFTFTSDLLRLIGDGNHAGLVRRLVLRKLMQILEAGFVIRYTSIYKIQKDDIYTK